ncbi:hypothetical protein GOP47_0004073 [Adiantum capillus-veneris]|uniref:Xyloglucan endotransglucosylase/hydrolase n=1 Tax=Adiantum capillus-veneris TaxID=13818 RepID=A0A9D4ZQ14_ADICA|nr:hypothetical protein GOP47_0004073 [Adiantum capillus-veneris]
MEPALQGFIKAESSRRSRIRQLISDNQVLAMAALLWPLLAMVMAGQIQGSRADSAPGHFNDHFYAGWRPDHVWLADEGRTINLMLDNNTGSGFRSYHSYAHGYVSISIKLVPSNSAGVVVAYYMSSERTNTTEDWDEIDFEFLGNVSGQPWILQTNIFTNGTGGREQRIFLWFDPTEDYHDYSMLWNPHQIVWYVDSVPVRIYRNTSITYATYPKYKPMAIYSSIWNGDSWATRGGLEKINWTYSPFITSYTNFLVDACEWNLPNQAPSCFWYTQPYWWDQPDKWTLSVAEKNYYMYYTKQYTIYDYCVDTLRYPNQMPECATPPWD